MAYFSRTKTVYETGDMVEVGCKETAFWGSYYTARIVQNLGDNNYVVEYKDILGHDGCTLYKYNVSGSDLRPLPPRKDQTSFGYGDQVDAFDKDGWWAGVVTGKRDGCYYSVFFETTKKHIEYPVSKLRAHLDWVYGTWYPGDNAAYLFDMISVPPVVPLDREFGGSRMEGGERDKGKNVRNKRSRVHDEDEEITRPLKIRTKLVEVG